MKYPYILFTLIIVSLPYIIRAQSNSEIIGDLKIVYSESSLMQKMLILERTNMGFSGHEGECTNNDCGMPTVTRKWSIKIGGGIGGSSGNSTLTPFYNCENNFGKDNELVQSYDGVVKGAFSYSDGSYVKASDRTLKKRIKYLEDSVLRGILKLKPAYYQYNSNNEMHSVSFGFVAQDVQHHFPELIRKFNGEYLGLNYDAFGVLAIKGIQEQEERIQQLELDNVALIERIEKLEKTISEI